jgi:3-dehydroquinate synthetase
VLALGGGAVLSETTRAELRRRAFTVVLDVDPAVAWERVREGGRPLAQGEERFRALYDERQPVYDEVADGRARDADDVVLAAAGVHVEMGALELLGELVPGQGPCELVTDTHVAGIHGVTAQLALGARDAAVHEVPSGEAAKTTTALERLWSALRLGRDGTLVALGGGCTTDLAGFAAATYMRGIAWVPVPTTLVGQVDAAIGGKTAIDLPGGKNLAGAFHWPARVVCDPGTLETLPEPELQNGLAEVVKTGLLAGEPHWELPRPAQVRACAAFKSAICLRDPRELGARAQLNLGHTFAHALEAAAGFDLAHGRAVALGLLAALRLSGQGEAAATVRDVLRPEPVRVDRDAAWAALARDKKAARGSPRLVLLDAPGRPRWGVELPETDVRAALDALIAD